MKFLKYFFSISFLLLTVFGCKKDKYEDTSLLQTDHAPAALAALFEITQDNTGLVTITPNGESISFYEVYYGDATTDPVKILPGKNVQHVYPEGVYNVKIVGHSITGIVTEATQPLTVSFRAPENLDFTAAIDLANNFKVNVSASATYETLFKVYFGEDPNETPVSFLEGTTVSHTYAAVGTYTIKVVAFSGGAATTELTKTVTIVNPVLLPLTFESSTLNYAFTNFGGGDVTVINNPQSNGINTSAKVGKMVKNAPEVWGGSFITLGSPDRFYCQQDFQDESIFSKSWRKSVVESRECNRW
ncbi:MAG: PKD domain-containing protein [Chitinophagaceae bacterium]|nr:PKD domain-containing protein [Chitinophagaceae bacterium]